MFVDRRPFPTASGSLNFDFGKEYGRTPQVLAEGGVLKAPALEGIKEETLPPNQERQDDSQFMFNGVYYQPWARDVRPLFQGSRMTPPLNYNRLPVGAEKLKRGVDRGGTMIDEEGKLVKVANYASNFKLKGNSAQELRRSFLLQSLENLNNKPSVRARDNLLKELKERGFYAPGDESRSLADLKQKVSDKAGQNGMSNDPWGEDPVFQEILEDIKQADETQLSSMLQQQEAMIRELQQLNQNNQIPRGPNPDKIAEAFNQTQEPETGYGAQQQGGELGYFNVVPPEAINRLQQATREQGLGTPAGNDLTAQADDQFFTPPQTERQLRQRQQASASGAGTSATAESGLTATSGTTSAEINESNIEQLSRNELSDNFTSEQLIEEARRHNVPQDVYLKQNDEPRAHNQIAKKLKSYFSSKKKK